MSYKPSLLLSEMLGNECNIPDDEHLISIDIVRLGAKYRKQNNLMPSLAKYFHRNYDEPSKRKILEEKHKYGLSIRETSLYFGVSKGTLLKWTREAEKLQY